MVIYVLRNKKSLQQVSTLKVYLSDSSAWFDVKCEISVESDEWFSELSMDPTISGKAQSVTCNWAPCFISLTKEAFLIPDTLILDRHLQNPTGIAPLLFKVWYSDNYLSETLKTWKANSHLPLLCLFHLRVCGRIPKVSKRPHQELEDQIKLTRTSWLEYPQGHLELPSSNQELPQLSRNVDQLHLVCVCHLGSWN